MDQATKDVWTAGSRLLAVFAYGDLEILGRRFIIDIQSSISDQIPLSRSLKPSAPGRARTNRTCYRAIWFNWRANSFCVDHIRAVAAMIVPTVAALTIGYGLRKPMDKGFAWVQGVFGRLIYAQYSDVQYTHADSGSKSHRQRQRLVLAVFGDGYNALSQKCNPPPCSSFCAATGVVLSTSGNSFSTRFFYRSSSGGVLRFFALGRLWT